MHVQCHVLHVIVTFFRWHSVIRDLLFRPLLARDRIGVTPCLCPRHLGPIRCPQWSSFTFVGTRSPSSSSRSRCTYMFIRPVFGSNLVQHSPCLETRNLEETTQCDCVSPWLLLSLLCPVAVHAPWLWLPCCCSSAAVCPLAIVGSALFAWLLSSLLGLLSRCWECRCLCRQALCAAWACAGRGPAGQLHSCMAPGLAPHRAPGTRQAQWP